VFVLTLCSCTILDPGRAQRKNESMQIGDGIVTAIYSYQKAKGVYPSSLDLLKPDYLSEIPKTKLGTPFNLHLADSDKFLLCFEDNGWCCYLGYLNSWDCSPPDQLIEFSQTRLSKDVFAFLAQPAFMSVCIVVT
jgi:hypothetical protein